MLLMPFMKPFIKRNDMNIEHNEENYKMSGQEMYEIRKNLGMSQLKFVRLIGFNTKSYISHFETGYRKIPKHLAFLCKLIKKEYSNDS